MEVINKVFEFLNNPFILTPLGLVLGRYLKWVPWFNTKAVPIITMISVGILKLADLLTQVAAPAAVPAGLVPAMHEMTLAVDMMPASFLGVGGALGAFMGATYGTILQGVITTGCHSLPKNVLQWIRGGARMILN